MSMPVWLNDILTKRRLEKGIEERMEMMGSKLQIKGITFNVTLYGKSIPASQCNIEWFPAERTMNIDIDK